MKKLYNASDLKIHRLYSLCWREISYDYELESYIQDIFFDFQGYILIYNENDIDYSFQDKKKIDMYSSDLQQHDCFISNNMECSLDSLTDKELLSEDEIDSIWKKFTEEQFSESNKLYESLFYDRLIYEKNIMGALNHSDLEEGYIDHYKEYRKRMLYGIEYNEDRARIIN